MLSCPLCSKTFSHRANLKVHVVSHTKEKPYKCLVCSASFGLAGGLKIHMTGVHGNVRVIKIKNYECPECNYKGSERSKFKKHLLTHSSEKPFSCDQPSCGFKTKYKRVLSQHVRGVHHQDRPYECQSDGCNFKGKSLPNLREHLKTHSNEKPFACEFPGCNYTCKIKKNLKGHTSSAHSDEKPFKCSVCDFRTKHKSNLTQHQATHIKIKRFACRVPNCRFASSRKTKLELHMDAKHRKKVLTCSAPRCTFRCASIAILTNHSKTHELPILKCPDDACNFSTRRKMWLLEHISHRHANMPSASLDVPRKQNPGTTREAGVVETLHCSFRDCDYQTEFPHRLDRHMLTHDKEENLKHICKFCSARFIGLRNLKVHIQRHVGEKPNSCAYCGYASLDGCALRRHTRSVHHIYVAPLGKPNRQESRCHTCGATLSSYCEFVLHSMTHLRPVVVLARLRVHVL